MIICGFPGIGKSHFFHKCKDFNITVHDSDSAYFDKSEFPQNYIKHLKELTKEQSKSDKPFYILSSSHKEVREALIENNLEFKVVVPDISLKSEYLNRYKERGSSKGFQKLINDNFETWITEIINDKRLDILILSKDQYLSDVI